MKTNRVRAAVPEDIPAIMQVLADGRATMRADGNLNQWVKGYPSEETIREDIRNGWGFAVCGDGSQIDGYFALIQGVEPTYLKIYEGAWLNDGPYGTIHRMAARHGAHGIFAAAMEFAAGRCSNIRIDTHRDNRIMQHNILAHGFSYCGIIYLSDGAERLAYQIVLASSSQ